MAKIPDSEEGRQWVRRKTQQNPLRVRMAYSPGAIGEVPE